MHSNISSACLDLLNLYSHFAVDITRLLSLWISYGNSPIQSQNCMQIKLKVGKVVQLLHYEKIYRKLEFYICNQIVPSQCGINREGTGFKSWSSIRYLSSGNWSIGSIGSNRKEKTNELCCVEKTFKYDSWMEIP